MSNWSKERASSGGVPPPLQAHNQQEMKGDSWQRQRQGQVDLSPEEFKAKEVDMRAVSAARWAENERFSLENAFALQLKRLEVRCAPHDEIDSHVGT